MELLNTPPAPPGEAPKGCLFCGRSLAGQRAKEHVFPRWLLRDFGLAEKGVAPFHASPKFELLSRRLHKLDDLVEGRICASCNGGWMSDLEVKAQVIVGPLINGTRELQSATRVERLLLARWAAKTAYVLNWSANYPRKVPLSHVRSLCTGPGLPDRVVVMASAYDGESRFSWLQSPSWSMELAGTPRDVAAEISSRSYKISLQLGQLMLLVAYWPEPGWLYRLDTAVHRNVWPPVMLWHLEYRAEQPRMDDPLFPVYWFHVMLGISDPPSLHDMPVWVQTRS